MMHDDKLAELARATLRANDRGGYTLPTDRLYPFQWNWDASLTALGWMSFDEPRAWQEIETLFAAQWGPHDYGGANDGFVAHIAFHQPSQTYFPGPDQWGTEQLAIRTSSISQPPLHATMVRWMHQRARDRARADAQVRALLPRLIAHHRWWYRARDPQGSGLVNCIHPWETGMDNSPAWDAPLAAVPPTTRAYERRDLDHVHASMRPPQAFYDRVVALMDANRLAGFDPARIAAEGRFQVHDIGIVCILQRASRDLAALCEAFGRAAEARELARHVARTDAASEQLWSPRWQQYVSFDKLSGQQLDHPTNAGLLGDYAGLPRSVAPAIEQMLGETPYALPSTRSGDPGFEPRRYWRGPIWQHMNMLIAAGLAERGRADLAERLRASSRALFDRAGFCEYYDPLTGEGLGGHTFSWTAATYLHWMAA